MEHVTYTTISCAVKDCPAHVITKMHWIDYLKIIEPWGWRRVLTSSPHPKVLNEHGSSVSWAITVFFCPKHQLLSKFPDCYTTADGKDGRPSYVVEFTKEAMLS